MPVLGWLSAAEPERPLPQTQREAGAAPGRLQGWLDQSKGRRAGEPFRHRFPQPLCCAGREPRLLRPLSSQETFPARPAPSTGPGLSPRAPPAAAQVSREASRAGLRAAGRARPAVEGGRPLPLRCLRSSLGPPTGGRASGPTALGLRAPGSMAEQTGSAAAPSRPAGGIAGREPGRPSPARRGSSGRLALPQTASAAQPPIPAGPGLLRQGREPTDGPASEGASPPGQAAVERPSEARRGSLHGQPSPDRRRRFLPG